MTRCRRMLQVFGLALVLAPCPGPAAAQGPEPLRYSVGLQQPETQRALVKALVPAAGREVVELMMPVWSPGYYVREDYASRVESLVARSPAGDTLVVTRPQPNRWRVRTGGARSITIEYVVRCTERFVTRNWVDRDLAVLNGAPTFITLADRAVRAHEVSFELPPAWRTSVTALAPVPGGRAHHYRAASYDELVDSPVVIGNVTVREFEVGGIPHRLADAGAVPPEWDGDLTARSLAQIVRATGRLWGFLPFDRYVYLNIFRQGGGGLEHAGSTLLTSSPRASGQGGIGWLRFVAHEYFHAFNVKRLRPVELGPFDYDRPPTTSSLWISEGLTSYYGNLLVTRAGIGGSSDYLEELSAAIRSLQNSPGRLRQTLEQASRAIFATGGSGVGGDRNTTVSYYVKGSVVGWLLDARIQRLSGGERSLDDVMRLAYRRYSDARGFTPQEFEAVAGEVARADLNAWFEHALRSTAELDYTEALDWFGLRFVPTEDPQTAWTLEVRPDATVAQRERLRRSLDGAAPPG